MLDKAYIGKALSRQMAKILATFRIKEEDWTAFKAWADSRGTNATSELIKYVRSCLGCIDEEAANLDRHIEAYLDRHLEDRIDENLELRIDDMLKSAISQQLREFVERLGRLDMRIAELERQSSSSYYAPRIVDVEARGQEAPESAKELSKLTTNELRDRCHSLGIKWRHAKGQNKHLKKAEMIEAILARQNR